MNNDLTEKELQDVQTEAAKVGAVDVKPMVRTDEIDNAIERTGVLTEALFGVPTDLYVTVHYSSEGTPPPGAEPGTP